MNITTIISFTEDEELDKGEVISFTKEVDDLDVYDMLWYFQQALGLAGADVKQLQIVTSDNKIISTDI